jgi:hypothetical protein
MKPQVVERTTKKEGGESDLNGLTKLAASSPFRECPALTWADVACHIDGSHRSAKHSQPIRDLFKLPDPSSSELLARHLKRTKLRPRRRRGMQRQRPRSSRRWRCSMLRLCAGAGPTRRYGRCSRAYSRLSTRWAGCEHSKWEKTDPSVRSPSPSH